MRRALPLLLALLPACASDDRLWTTYQSAGEAAALHARWDKAEGLLSRALAESAGRPAERVRSQLALARLGRERGDAEAARAWLARAQASAAELSPDSPEAARLALESAWLELEDGDAGEAAAQFEEAARRTRSALGDGDPSVGWALAGRGEALRRRGDRAGSRAALDEALRRFSGEASADAIRPAEPLGAVAALISLGSLLREERDLEQARAALHRASAIGGRELGSDHPRLAAALAELAQVELARGDLAAAARAADRAVAISRAHLPEDHATRLAAEEALGALAR